ncbi:hypothetical protein [Burkholderia cepacia]|uniref:hypothetical protein n=1 Tax=Burkholderia cepacia TaxID=292 RepID=UPI00158E5904|nr:hypothetical protein [Burkholderia cepacia]
MTEKEYLIKTLRRLAYGGEASIIINVDTYKMEIGKTGKPYRKYGQYDEVVRFVEFSNFFYFLRYYTDSNGDIFRYREYITIDLMELYVSELTDELGIKHNVWKNRFGICKQFVAYEWQDKIKPELKKLILNEKLKHELSVNDVKVKIQKI